MALRLHREPGRPWTATVLKPSDSKLVAQHRSVTHQIKEKRRGSSSSNRTVCCWCAKMGLSSSPVCNPQVRKCWWQATGHTELIHPLDSTPLQRIPPSLMWTKDKNFGRRHFTKSARHQRPPTQSWTARTKTAVFRKSAGTACEKR